MRELLAAMCGLWRSVIGPYVPDLCKFTPSCSHYAAEAVVRRGVVRGSIAALWRILRCNPFSKGGYDPVVPSAPPCHCPEHEPGSAQALAGRRRQR